MVNLFVGLIPHYHAGRNLCALILMPLAKAAEAVPAFLAGSASLDVERQTGWIGLHFGHYVRFVWARTFDRAVWKLGAEQVFSRRVLDDQPFGPAAATGCTHNKQRGDRDH